MRVRKGLPREAGKFLPALTFTQRHPTLRLFYYLFMGTKLSEQLGALAIMQSRRCVCEIGLEEPHASCHYQHKSYTLGKRKSIRWAPSNWCFRREITWGKMDPSRKALKRSKTWDTTTTKLQLFQEDLILNETNSSCYLFKMPFVYIYI